VTVNVLQPIHPTETNFDSRKLRDLVKDKMAAELARMRSEG